MVVIPDLVEGALVIEVRHREGEQADGQLAGEFSRVSQRHAATERAALMLTQECSRIA
jgi:hypothetical protein